MEGIYENPRYFTGVRKDAKLVYTDSPEIAKLYADENIDVLPITKPKPKPRARKKKA